MTNVDSPTTDRDVMVPGKNWGWVLATGILFVFLGFGALNLPVDTTIGFMIALAGLLVAVGVIHLVQAVRLRHESGSIGRFFQAIIPIFVGGLMFRYPEGGMLGVALMLSFYFMVGAASQWILFSLTRPFPGRGWALASSIASFMLGVYIVLTFPFSAMWVPGALLGIDLLISGGAMIGFSQTLRRVYREVSPRRQQTIQASAQPI